MTTANAIMWCDIFHLFVGRNKKRKLVMKGNYWLNVKIEGHIANLYCLFPYFKNMRPFYLHLFQHIKIFIFLLVVGRKKSLSFHGRDVNFADGIVLLDFFGYHYELYFPPIAK